MHSVGSRSYREGGPAGNDADFEVGIELENGTQADVPRAKRWMLLWRQRSMAMQLQTHDQLSFDGNICSRDREHEKQQQLVCALRKNWCTHLSSLSQVASPL